MWQYLYIIKQLLIFYKHTSHPISFYFLYIKYHQHQVNFQDLGLKEEILDIIKKNGIESPSVVQIQSIPHILARKDVLVQAKSGQGKTLCFVLSILNLLKEEKKPETFQPQALILANTRELAVQIKDEFVRFSMGYLSHIRVQAIIGGNPINEQIKQLKEEKPNIVVATTGRLADLIQRKEIDLTQVQYFVIDEVDLMLCPPEEKKSSQKQKEQLKLILDQLKQKHLQSMFFSATFTEKSREEAKKLLNMSCEIIQLTDDKLFLNGLKQSYIVLTEAQKLKKVIQILEEKKFSQCIIFVKDLDRAKALQQYLQDQKIDCRSFHSGLTSQQRNDLCKQFKQCNIRCIISTDIFQRGVDFESLDLVIHFDMPINSDSYLHRSGRAGRFETKGYVISFVTTEEDKKVLKDIQDRFVVEIKEEAL